MIRWLCICAAAVCYAGDPAWDWLPAAADDDRICEIHLTAPDGWRELPDARVEASRVDGQIVLRFEPRQIASVAVAGPDERRLGIRLIAPGQATGLQSDALGRLRIGTDAAILAVPRREAAADRRWGILRLFERHRHAACSVRLDPPASTTPGVPALTRQIAQAQSTEVRGRGVLIALSGDDRFAAWKHREYRQALAWLVADLAARGASHVVLLEPACPSVDQPLLTPLLAQVRDVATAYRCNLISAASLAEHAAWEIAPGVLGTSLNAAGRERLETLLRPWLGDG